MRRPTLGRLAAVVSAFVLAPITTAADPWADVVVDYVPGAGAAPYTDSAVALGAPERCTGEGVFPGVVSICNAPWMIDEIVSIGDGGHLVLAFDEPVLDDPANPFGVDLLVFGNAFFVEGGAGIADLFGEGGVIEVSPDGATWAMVSGTADGLFPTRGWLDAGPFDVDPGTVATLFTRPVEPALALGDYLGLDHDAAAALYGASGGGTPVDLAGTGFASITHVRITNIDGAGAVEIDAVADVVPLVPGDANADGRTDVQDLVAVILAWGSTLAHHPADVDGSGMVDVGDVVGVVVGWTG